MKIKKTYATKLLCATMAAAGLILAASGASAAVNKVRCITWQGDPAKYHTAISGQAAQLKAVINASDTSAIYYKWVYGDGTESPVSSLSGKTQHNVTINHTYTGGVGAPFTAKLVVGNDNTLTSGVIEDTYLLKIEDGANVDAKVNIAIDKGLWWLFTNAQSNNPIYGGNYGGWTQTYDGSSAMAWVQTSYASTLASPTASAVHAFGVNGHKMKGDSNQDPYVEAVQLGMNYLMKGYRSSTGNPALRAMAIAPVNHGGVLEDPEAGQAVPNGYGIEAYDGAGDPPYQSGQIMDAIIACGAAPSDLTGRDFAPGTPKSHIWTYGEVLQDMADMHAWGQWDGTGCNGGVCGSWWYGWNYSSPGDNSASQWGAIGMLPAQDTPWNVKIPQWVKDYNANWLAYSMGCTGPSSAVTACGNPADARYNRFSYNGFGGCAGDDCLQTTTSGMVQMIFDGQTSADLKWDRAHKYIADRWQNFTHAGSSWGGPKTYGWYSFAKAMRLSLPTATTNLTKTSGATFDWYYGDPSNATCANEATCEKGLAPRILEIQNGDGSWSGNLTNQPLTTAWMIITLKPALFAAAPIACFDYTPKSTYSGDTVTFSPSCSGHSEAGKTIANLTKFEWDWNNDGVFEESTTAPTATTNSFTCGTPPCSFPVTLKVTDDNNPALTATAKQNVTITNPPHPPVAKAGGPYIASLCTGDTLTLDGSTSFDPNEGQHEAGCTSCPNDTITAWNWDLVAPMTEFTDKSGKTVAMTSPFAGDLGTAGAKDIGLRVADNTALAFPGSGQPNLTNDAFARVTIYSATACNLTARGKAVNATSGQIQLVWTAIPGATYDIYRSSTGPNSGFALIKDDLASTYATYLDTTAQTGVTYWYRIMPSSGGASKAVAAKALMR